MKNSISQIRNIFVILIAAIFLGTLLILAAYAIPTGRICHNLQRSADTYKIEGDAPRWGGVVNTRLDNFTTSIMLMKAAYPVEGKILNSALLNPSWQWQNSPVETLIKVAENNLQAENNAWNYPRYWHGYLIILKPLLNAFNLSHLRELNFFLQFFLTVTALLLMYQKLGLYHAYIFALILAIINPVTAALDLQISGVFYIMIIAVIFILRKNDWLKCGANILYFFVLIGIFTAYFDLLTYPLVTFGIPLCVYFFINRGNFWAVLKYLFARSFGYFGMWGGKWIVASIFTDSNVVADAIGAAIYRSSFNLAGATDFTITQMFAKVIGTFFNGTAGIFAAISLLYVLYRSIKNRKNISFNAALFVIVTLPFFWCLILSNHSFVHNFLSYREFTIALYAILGFSCKNI